MATVFAGVGVCAVVEELEPFIDWAVGAQTLMVMG